MRRSQFVFRFPSYSSLIFHRGHRRSVPIPGAWAIHPKEPRNLARLIRAENRNSGNRISADDIACGYNLRSIERHPAFAYRGKPLSDQQIRLVRNMRVQLRRR